MISFLVTDTAVAGARRGTENEAEIAVTVVKERVALIADHVQGEKRNY